MYLTRIKHFVELGSFTIISIISFKELAGGKEASSEVFLLEHFELYLDIFPPQCTFSFTFQGSFFFHM